MNIYSKDLLNKKIKRGCFEIYVNIEKSLCEEDIDKYSFGASDEFGESPYARYQTLDELIGDLEELLNEIKKINKEENKDE